MRFNTNLSLIAVALLGAFSLLPVSAGAAEGVSVTSGEMTTTFNGLLQTWSLGDTKASDGNVNFRLRRAELKLSGAVEQDFRWVVMVDPSKSIKFDKDGKVIASGDNKILQDLAVGFNLTPELDMTAGQFKIPTTAEGLDPSGQLLLPERSYIGRTYGDRREAGLAVGYKLPEVQLRAMISNGQGPNVETPTATTKKDLNLRADVPLYKQFKVGAFTTAGAMNYATKGRWGVNARMEMSRIVARIEGVHTNDLGILGDGVTLEGGYQATEKFQPVARFDNFRNGAFTGSEVAAGLNYSVMRYGKIQASYSILHNMTGNSGTPALGLTPSDGGLVNLAFQASI